MRLVRAGTLRRAVERSMHFLICVSMLTLIANCYIFRSRAMSAIFPLLLLLCDFTPIPGHAVEIFFDDFGVQEVVFHLRSRPEVWAR
jgi:hypothetical protein